MTPEQVAAAMPQVEAHVAMGLIAFPARQVADTKKPRYRGWQSKVWDLGMLAAELRNVPYYGLTQPKGNPRRLIDLDLDDGSNGLQPGQVPWRERWEAVGAPPTKTTATPSGGWHVWYLWPDGVPLPTGTWHGFTVRSLVGARNFVIGPGSVRPDGKPYRDAYPDRAIATMPVDLALGGLTPAEAAQARGRGDHGVTVAGYVLPDKITQGGRNSTLLKYTLSLYNHEEFWDGAELDLERMFRRVVRDYEPRLTNPFEPPRTLRSEFDKVTKGIEAKGGEPAFRQRDTEPEPDEGEPPRPDKAAGSAGTRLVKLALGSGAVFLSDERGQPWVRLPSHGVLSFSDGGVSDWLRRVAYGAERRAPTDGTITEARDTLAAEARFGGIIEPVYLRVGPLPDGGMALDLGGPDWTSAVVRADGWTIAPAPVNFRRTRDAMPLPTPQPGGDVRALAKVLNLGAGEDGERHLRLVIAFLLAAVRPKGPYLGLALTGVAGSAKTFVARCLRQLIDPTPRDGGGGVASLSRNEDAFAAAAMGAWLPIFDNLSGTSSEQADWLCQLLTGYSTTRRKLYTDDGTFERSARRPLILTGIDVTDRDDLLSRLLVVDLPELDQGHATEDELWTEFDALAGGILGGLLDALVSAVAIAPTLPTRGWPRMADAARWVTGAEPALGWPDRWFATALHEEQANARASILADLPWYQPFVALLDRREPWEGTATDLLNDLRKEATAALGEYERLDTFGWPKTPTGLRVALKRHADALRSQGIRVRSERGRTARALRVDRPSAGDAVTLVTHQTLMYPLGVKEEKREGEEEGEEDRNKVGTYGKSASQVSQVASVRTASVRCDDYRAHRSHHQRIGAEFVCMVCSPAEATMSPEAGPEWPSQDPGP